MITRFKLDEQGYERWLKAHRKGFVFNHSGGSNPYDNLLHASTCDHLYRLQDCGRRTQVEKICCDDSKALIDEIESLRGRGGWRRCATCSPH